MKRVIISVLTVSALVFGTLSLKAMTAPPASASSYACVDNYEWNTFQLGWGKGAIESLFDTRGWTHRSYGDTWIKRYDYCGWTYSVAQVRYYWNGYKWISLSAKRFYS